MSISGRKALRDFGREKMKPENTEVKSTEHATVDTPRNIKPGRAGGASKICEASPTADQVVSAVSRKKTSYETRLIA
jgi:hypothetical protein